MKKLDSKVRDIVFICEGGIGKNIVGTAVVRAIKKQYPDKNIIVVAGCPDAFLYNPNVKRTYNFGNPLYFFEDHVNDETVIFKAEPYLHYDYINKNKHVVECWCEMLGVEFDGINPDLYFIPNELEAAKLYYDEITGKGLKGLALIQWIGGGVPESGEDKALKEKLAQMYKRSIPKKTVEEITKFLAKKNYTVGIVGHPNFPTIENTVKIFFNIRATLALFKIADIFVGIDSFGQHVCAANQINKNGVILWGGTSPKVLGYESNNNLIKEVCSNPFCHRPNSYLFDINPQGTVWDCPYGEPCLKYEANEVIEEIKPLLKKFKGGKIPTTPKQQKQSCCR